MAETHPTSHVISRDPTHLVWTLNIFIPTPILNKILCSWTHIKGKKDVNTFTDSEFQNILGISHLRMKINYIMHIKCEDAKCDGERRPTLKDPIFVSRVMWLGCQTRCIGSCKITWPSH